MANERERWKGLLQPTEACLESRELWDFLQGSMDEVTRERTKAHLNDCPRCLAELSLARAFDSLAPNPEENEAVRWIEVRLKERSSQILAESQKATQRESPSRTSVPFLRRWPLFAHRGMRMALIGVAVSLVLIASGLILKNSREIAAPDIDPAAPVLRSANLDPVFPLGVLDRAPAELRWQEIGSAARYQASLLEVDRVEIWQSETSRSSLPLPQEVKARIVPGKKLFWQVKAFDGSGRQIATSDVVSFSLVLTSKN